MHGTTYSMTCIITCYMIAMAFNKLLYRSRDVTCAFSNAHLSDTNVKRLLGNSQQFLRLDRNFSHPSGKCGVSNVTFKKGATINRDDVTLF